MSVVKKVLKYIVDVKYAIRRDFGTFYSTLTAGISGTTTTMDVRGCRELFHGDL
jgi:hypothetical protein